VCMANCKSNLQVTKYNVIAIPITGKSKIVLHPIFP